MNLNKLNAIELSPEMNRLIIEALISKQDYTSLYATKLIIELNAELVGYRAGDEAHRVVC